MNQGTSGSRSFRTLFWVALLTTVLCGAHGFAQEQTAPEKGAAAQAKPKPQPKVKAKAKPGDEILGEWWTEDNEGRVRFKRHRDGTFRGVTTCCKAQKDVKNPDPNMRSRSTIGIVLIWQLAYEGEGEYEGGKVYNPRDGKTYRMDVEVVDRNTIEVRGYLGLSLFGQTQVWKRYRPSGG